MNGDSEDGAFIFLAPARNTPCVEAVAAFRRCVRRDESFGFWTLEEVLDDLRAVSDAAWITALRDRYLGVAE